MQVELQELAKASGLNEALYPGKKLVRRYPQPGENKAHCAVFDWRGRHLRFEILAGLSGYTLEAAQLKHYPINFQAPTYVEFKALLEKKKRREEDEEEGGETSVGKTGSGGGARFKQSLSDLAFDDASDGAVPTHGEITKFVVMGKKLAREAFAQAYENLKEQVRQTKIMTIDLTKGVTNLIQKATPGGGLQAKGDESVSYQYDQERNAPLFGGVAPG